MTGKKDNSKLFKPCVKDMIVKDQECKVLRDSAAAVDVVHPKYISSSEYLSDFSWIRQAVNVCIVCLPMAKVRIEGPFGFHETEA